MKIKNMLVSEDCLNRIITHCILTQKPKSEEEAKRIVKEKVDMFVRLIK